MKIMATQTFLNGAPCTARYCPRQGTTRRARRSLPYQALLHDSQERTPRERIRHWRSTSIRLQPIQADGIVICDVEIGNESPTIFPADFVETAALSYCS